MRKWHHNRSGKPISLDEMMENEDGDIFEVADPRGEFEQKVISEMQIAAFAEQNITEKDREILKLRMDGLTEQEIADKVGYKTASAVHMYSASFGAFPSKNRNTFLIQELEKSMKIRRFYENRAYQEAKDYRDLF